MNPNDMKKEAEQIAKWFFQVDDPQQKQCKDMVLKALSGVHDVGYAEGFQHAREKAAEQVRLKLSRFIPNSGAANVICECVEDIRALQPEDGE